MKRRINRMASALSIRSAAMAVMKAEGKREVIAGIPVQTVAFECLSAFHTTTRRIAEKVQLRGTDLGSPSIQKQYTWREQHSLDIWYADKGKVFHLAWSAHDHPVKLVRFIYGRWEGVLRERAGLFDATFLPQAYHGLSV